ncbi:MAG: CHASE2 domain-containing protein, partial [Spirochaetota bacterium]
MSSRALRGAIRVVIALVIAGAGALMITSDFGRSIELRAYDSALRFVPDPALDDEIVIVGIDDQAVDMVGSWPWPRSVVGDGLILLKSLGAETIVLDIEYDDESPVVVDEQRFEDDLRSVFGELSGDLGELAGALETGRIEADGATRVLTELAGRLVSPDGPRNRLQQTLLDRDAYLGAAIRATSATVVAASFHDRGEPGGFTLPPLIPQLTVSGDGVPTEATAINGPISDVVSGAV